MQAVAADEIFALILLAVDDFAFDFFANVSRNLIGCDVAKIVANAAVVVLDLLATHQSFGFARHVISPCVCFGSRQSLAMLR